MQDTECSYNLSIRAEFHVLHNELVKVQCKDWISYYEPLFIYDYELDHERSCIIVYMNILCSLQ